MEHGISQFLFPSPLARLSFLFSRAELLVQALNGHERVLYRGLHGNLELAFLLAKLEGDSFQDLWEFPQNLQRNVPVGSRNFGLGDHPISTDQPKKECGYGEGSKAHWCHWRIGKRNARSKPVPVDGKTLIPIQDTDNHKLNIEIAKSWLSGSYPKKSNLSKNPKLFTGLL